MNADRFIAGVFRAVMARRNGPFEAVADEVIALLNRPKVQEVLMYEIGPHYEEWFAKKKQEHAAAKESA